MASSGYTPWSVTAGEIPTTAYWNLLGANDSSFNTGTGFNDGIILPRHFASGSVGKPNYLQSTVNNNGTSSRQTGTTSFVITGTSLTYTTGSTNEVIHLSGIGLIYSTAAGGGLVLQANGTNIGRRSWTDATNAITHNPNCLFPALANTSYTFTIQVIASGTTTIVNANTDPTNQLPSLELISFQSN